MITNTNFGQFCFIDPIPPKPISVTLEAAASCHNWLYVGRCKTNKWRDFLKQNWQMFFFHM